MVLRPTLLVIDDDRATREMLRALFKELNVVVATNGRDALTMLNEQPPTIIIVDLLLGGNISGLDIVEMLRTADETCHIPLVGISAALWRGERGRRFVDLIDAYFDKPYDLRKMHDTVLSLLGASV